MLCWFFGLYLSKLADKISALVRAFLSVFLRFFAILCIFFALFNVVEDRDLSLSLILFAILFSIAIALDEIFHSPIAFIAAKRAEVNLVRFRVSQILLIRGANVITPTLALFFIESVMFALYILIFCLLLSLLSSGILGTIEKPKSIKESSFEILEFQRKIVLVYFFLMFGLNLVFGHTAAIMLAFHKSNNNIFALHSFLFFSGFVLTSIYLVLYPSTFSKLIKKEDLNKLLYLISFSLILISLFVFGGTSDIVFLSYASILLFGIIYGINLHLVTTMLPSFLHIENIFKNMNYGRVAASLGFMFSGLYVGYFSSSHFDIINFYYIMSFGSFVISLFIILSKFYLKRLIN